MPIILQDEVLEFEWSSVRIEWGPKKETVGGHYFYPAEMSENKSEEQDSCLPMMLKMNRFFSQFIDHSEYLRHIRCDWLFREK